MELQLVNRAERRRLARSGPPRVTGTGTGVVPPTRSGQYVMLEWIPDEDVPAEHRAFVQGHVDRPAGSAKYQIFVVGPGTMTVYLTDDPQDPPAQGTVELWRVDITQPTNPSGAPSPDVHTRLSTVPLSKPSTTVLVPDDGACLHYVAVVDSASVGQSVGFGGWSWTAA